MQVDDNDNSIVHIHGRYADRLVQDSNKKINLTDSTSPLQRELEHFIASVQKNDNNSINGIAHIERVYFLKFVEFV